MGKERTCGLEIRNHALDCWYPLLYEWTQCFSKFCKESGTMPVLSKKEVTNVGILAGAAWRMGFVAFQEMSRLKSRWVAMDLMTYIFANRQAGLRIILNAKEAGFKMPGKH
jgi:hypothetical protein